MNMLLLGSQRPGSSHSQLWRNIVVFVSRLGFWLKNGLPCILSGKGIRCISLSFPLPPPPPPLSTLIGRDSHHMCKGKVMGGMAALISERLPADKANGCGEAWASALLRNKHFHFVWLEWRMERWKWWIDDLRNRGGMGEIDGMDVDVIQY